jgi:pyridoxine 4-dehydrogenase
MQGSWREPDADWRRQVHDNLRNLGLDTLEVVNLRVHGGSMFGPERGARSRSNLTALAGLQQQGLIRHLGLSNVTAAQVARPAASARWSASRISTTWRIAAMTTLVDLSWRERASPTCRSSRSAASTPLQSEALSGWRSDAWARRRCRWRWPGCSKGAPNILLIPGTSSVGHLRENLAVVEIRLSDEVFGELSAIGKAA